MMLFFRIIKHLLPNALAWRLTIVNQLREFFEGLSELGQSVKDFADGVYNDIFPQTTRELSAWEIQFGLPQTLSDDQERRARLDGAWKAQGGQSPSYIQNTLRNAGFDVYVHEWWKLPQEPVQPQIPRNPLLVLQSTGTAVILAQDGFESSQDGNSEMQDGFLSSGVGYPLVNKPLLDVFKDIAQDGIEGMQDGNDFAQDGLKAIVAGEEYLIPNNPVYWPYFIYIAGLNFNDNYPGIPTPDVALVPLERKNEFETLLLKICPTQNWIGVIVNYT